MYFSVVSYRKNVLHMACSIFETKTRQTVCRKPLNRPIFVSEIPVKVVLDDSSKDLPATNNRHVKSGCLSRSKSHGRPTINCPELDSIDLSIDNDWWILILLLIDQRGEQLSSPK